MTFYVLCENPPHCNEALQPEYSRSPLSVSFTSPLNNPWFSWASSLLLFSKLAVNGGHDISLQP